MLYYDVNEQEYFDRIKAAWDVADGLIFTVGADIFEGEDGAFGLYRDNSQAWFKVKYAF